jgi:hypothetical protein
MGNDNKVAFLKPAGTSASEELDALNVETRRKVGAVPMIEATIEARAKKRRRQEKPGGSAWKKAS